MSVEQRLRELERRLQNIEGAQQSGGSEAFSPTYLTIDPASGVTSANFTGTVHATGLQMDAGTATPNQIQWLRTTDGAVVANILGNTLGTRMGVLTMEADDPSDAGARNSYSQFILNVDGGTAGGTQAEVIVRSLQGGGSPHQINKIIIDDLGRSNFIQTANGNSNVQALGDPATLYTASGTGAVAANTLTEVFQVISPFVYFDPGGRILSGRYQCRNAGNYLVTANASWTSIGGHVAMVIQNLTGGALEVDGNCNSGTGGIHMSAIMQASVGDLLTMKVRSDVALTLQSGGQAGSAGCSMSVIQVF